MSKKDVESAIKFIADNARFHHVPICDSAVWEYDDIVYASDSFQVLRTLENISKKLLYQQTEKTKKALASLFDEKMLTSVKKRICPKLETLMSEIQYEKTNFKSKNKNIPIWKATIAYGITDELAVNAEYLLNALKSTRATAMYLTGRHNPIYFLGEDTQYAVLPIRNDGNLTAGEFKILN